MLSSETFNEYYSLRDGLDNRCEELYLEHARHLSCRAGCDRCCMNFGILPVEFHAIKLEAGDNFTNAKVPEQEGGCPFLVNHRCVIYESRPLICRTQGLPLLFMNDEQWELSACELNFTHYDFDDFNEENTFPQDRYNSRLYLLNLKFIEGFSEIRYSASDLIPLSNLYDPATQTEKKP